MPENKDKLTEEALKGILTNAFDDYRLCIRSDSPEQMHEILEESAKAEDQIKEIVKEHFGLKNWTCTFEEYYALPEPIRNYIAALETNADPPSMVRENIYFKETAKALERKNELLMQTIKAQQKPSVTREWVEDLRDLFFDWEHSQDEPVDRSTGQRSKDEVWEEIREAFTKINVEVEEK